MNITGAILLGVAGGACVMGACLPKWAKEKLSGPFGNRLVLLDAIDIFDVFGKNLSDFNEPALSARYDTLKSQIEKSSPFVRDELRRLEDFRERAIAYRERVTQRIAANPALN